MRKAYDTFLQSEVSADLAAKSGGLEPYRYECAHCGEEVRLAAVGSISMVSHFRHRSGNSDIECEHYLGQYGAINIDAHSRKSKNERAEFYFDSMTKMFFLGIRFSDEEISSYEEHDASFELRTATQAPSICSMRINNYNFDSNTQTMIPIESFSYNYYLSNTLSNTKRKYEVFKNNNNTPTFFKIQTNDSNYRAKLVRSSVLYTGISYFMVFQRPYRSSLDSSMPSEITIDSSFNFETMGKRFSGKVLTIKTKTAQIDDLINSWGYQLEASETLTLLWPPASIAEDITIINSNYAYIYSTFELQAHGNINVHYEDINIVSNGITRVSINSQTKIYKKNAELVIGHCSLPVKEFGVIPISKEIANKYVVPDELSCFLFNRSGVVPLSKGMTIYLTPKSEIRNYLSGYYSGCITMESNFVKTSEALLRDIISYYKRMEQFKMNEFDLLELSQTALQYIEDCKKVGKINSAARRFIKEGRI